MRWLLFFIALIILVMRAILTDALRLAKTLWLIVQVTPYEQSGTGPSPKKILVVGDSTGYGTGAGSDKNTIAGRMGRDFPAYSIENNSKNGRTIGEAVTTMKSFPVEKSYTVILLQIGGNDILQKRPLGVVRSELIELYIEANKRAEKVVMMSSGNVGGAAAFVGTPNALQYERLSREFREMFILAAKETGMTYVDLFHEPKDDVFVLEPKKYLAIDGLHPSAFGYEVWYQSLRPILKQELE